MQQAENLRHTAGIRHGFFTRENGVSNGIYAGLNCGHGSNDETEAVTQNRAIVADAMGVDPQRLLSVFQIHSPTAVIVDDVWQREDAPQADAMVTNQADIAIGILVADCAPVLFADADAGVIGAAHAGWKGAVGGVVQATVVAMQELGAEPVRIRAAIGPCIRQKSYEVDDGFRDRLIDLDDLNDRFFAGGSRAGHHQFDLAGFVQHQVKRAGVGDCTVVPGDTYADESRFYSFRRATHRSEPDYGRNIAAIALGN